MIKIAMSVYSYGIVLYELVTRDEPYNGQPAMEVAYLAAEKVECFSFFLLLVNL